MNEQKKKLRRPGIVDWLPSPLGVAGWASFLDLPWGGRKMASRAVLEWFVANTMAHTCHHQTLTESHESLMCSLKRVISTL